MATQPAAAVSRASANPVSITSYWDNDGGYTKLYDPTDRHYTCGVGLSVQWQGDRTNDVVGTLPSIHDEFAPGRPQVTYAAGVTGMMKIYTPRDLSDPNPIFDDRPYAGWSYIGIIVQRANRSGPTPTMEHFELDLGTMGPQSQAGYTQRFIHDKFDQETPEGWQYQVGNEVGGDFKYQRHWRMDLVKGPNGDDAVLQLLPYLDATLGTIHINGSAGVVLRYGVNLPDNFGPGRQDWAADFTSPRAGRSRAPNAYVFVRPAGQVVAHDATLGKSFFNDSIVEADPFPFVFEVQAGVAVHLFGHMSVVYSQTFTSLQFQDQQQWDSYGSVVLSGEWAW